MSTELGDHPFFYLSSIWPRFIITMITFSYEGHGPAIENEVIQVCLVGSRRHNFSKACHSESTPDRVQGLYIDVQLNRE